MDTLLSELTVSGAVGMIMGLTVGCSLIVLGLKTAWEYTVDLVLFYKVAGREQKQEQ